MTWKKVTTLIFCCILVVGMVSCSQKLEKEENGKESIHELYWDFKPEEIPIFDVENKGYHITAAVLVENDTVKALSKEEFLEMIQKKESMRLAAEVKEEYSVKEGIVVFSADRLCRISALYEKAASIGVGKRLVFKRVLNIEPQEENTDFNIEEIDNAIKEMFNLKEEAAMPSFENDAGKLISTDKYKYSATAFIPKLCKIEGQYKNDKIQLDVSGIYPYTGDTTYLNGIYLLIESNEAEMMPD